MVIIVFSSCQQQDEIVPVVNFEKIKTQLAIAAMPDSTQAAVFDSTQTVVLKEPELKSANYVGENFTIKIIPCDQQVYEIDEYRGTASRYLNYFKRASNGYLLNRLTLKETFNISNGEIDLNSSLLTLYKVGWGFKRDLYLEDQENICRVDYFWRPEKNGVAQFSFFSDWDWRVEIPSSFGGQYQIRVHYCDGQVFSSDLIDYYNQPEILTLRLYLEKEKVVSSINIDRSWIEGAENLVLFSKEDENGEFQRLDYPVLFDETLKERIMYSAPFDIDRIRISGPQMWDYYYTQDATVSYSINDGSKIYIF